MSKKFFVFGTHYFVSLSVLSKPTDPWYTDSVTVAASVAGSVVPRDVQGNEITGGERNGAANSGEWNRYQLVNGMVICQWFVVIHGIEWDFFMQGLDGI